MKIMLNGEATEVVANHLGAALEELGYGGATVATAVNAGFVPREARADWQLRDGDRVEVVAPLRGG